MKELYKFRQFLTEGVIKEDKGLDYLKKAFQIYLEGGDDFNKEVGETETVKFENDESLIPKKEFEVALQSLPTTVKVDVYNVNFKKVGDNIIGTFNLAEDVVKEDYKNEYANSEEDFTDGMVVQKIKDIIKYHELDPQDVIDEIRIEFGVDAMD